MNTKEIRICLEKIKKDYPGAEKYINALETKLYLMRLEGAVNDANSK